MSPERATIMKAGARPYFGRELRHLSITAPVSMGKTVWRKMAAMAQLGRRRAARRSHEADGMGSAPGPLGGHGSASGVGSSGRGDRNGAFENRSGCLAICR